MSGLMAATFLGVNRCQVTDSRVGSSSHGVTSVGSRMRRSGLQALVLFSLQLRVPAEAIPGLVYGDGMVSSTPSRTTEASASIVTLPTVTPYPPEDNSTHTVSSTQSVSLTKQEEEIASGLSNLSNLTSSNESNASSESAAETSGADTKEGIDWDGDKIAYHEKLEEEAVDESYKDFEEMAAKVSMLFSASFMLACVIGNLMHMGHISFIPESLVVILIGMVLGFIEVEIPDVVLTIRDETLYNKLVLSLFLLPIIIFEAGWSMRHKDFIAQLGYILVFAVFGTIICMAVVAGLTIATSQWHGIDNVRVAFVYGALISAVDPVATLATYAHLNVDPLLNIMVLGESIINDAVAIVLFSVLNDKPQSFFVEHTNAQVSLAISLGVLKLLGGSIGLGIALGAAYVLFIRCTLLAHSPSLAILFIFTSAFFSYTFAEIVCKLSGIITVLFAGMLMSSHLTPHLTTEGRLLTSFLLKQMSSLADMAVFLFVGIAVVYASTRGLIFGCFMMAFCLLGRAVATVPLALVVNACKARKTTPPEQQTNLSWRHIFMMWHAGLRGGIALVLALELGPWVDKENGPGTRETLRNATLLVIVAFLLVFGGTTEIFLKCMGLPMGNPPPMPVRGSRFRRMLMSIAGNFLKPILVGGKQVEDHMPGGIVKQILSEAEARKSGGLDPKLQPSTHDTEDEKKEFATDAYDLFGQTEFRAQQKWMDQSDAEESEDSSGDYYGEDGDELGSLMTTPLY